MALPKAKIGSDGKLFHFSVGAVIQKDNRYLLIDRVNPPYGYAGLAGHVDEGESAVQALEREVNEESGLTVIRHRLLYEEKLLNNSCRHGIAIHYWYLFQCEVEGEIIQNRLETKSIGWFSLPQLKTLPLEPVWENCFKKLKLII